MSMSKVSMALDDVIKADRKANKGNKNGKNNSTGGNKKNGNARRGAAKSPATAQLVKKLVKRALAQRGVGVKPRNVRQNNAGNRTVVKKVIRKVNGPARGNRGNLGVSNKSRTIVRRRVIPAPQPTRTVVREIRYIREPPSPRVQRRVIYQQPRPAARQIVYVDAAPRRQQQRFNDGGRRSFAGRRPAVRRNNDPFYEPRNFLQRLPAAGRY
jgi:hypothetical protein